MVAVLSPGRAELLRGLAAIAPAERFATISIAPETTMNRFLLVCSYSVMFLMIYHLSALWEDRRWAMVVPLVVVAAVEAGLGIVQASAGETASGTYGNYDHFAGLLEMVLPFCVAYPLAVWRRSDWRGQFPLRPALRMCAGFGVGALLLVGILFPLADGFVATLFSLLVMGVVARLGSGRSLLLAALAGAALIGAFVLLLPSDQLISRFGLLSTTEQLTGDTRLHLWRESLHLYRAFPVFGCGLGGFESAFLRYKVVAPLGTADYAHNDYLQLLIELGAVGFAIGAVLFTAIVTRAIRANSRRYDPDTRYLAIGCIGAFTAIGLHSLVDFNLYVPANATALAWIAGLAASLQGTATRLPEKEQPHGVAADHRYHADVIGARSALGAPRHQTADTLRGETYFEPLSLGALVNATPAPMPPATPAEPSTIGSVLPAPDAITEPSRSVPTP